MPSSLRYLSFTRRVSISSSLNEMTAAPPTKLLNTRVSKLSGLQNFSASSLSISFIPGASTSDFKFLSIFTYSFSGTGFENRKPWIYMQPMLLRYSACSGVSTPSAITGVPSQFAIRIMELMIIPPRLVRFPRMNAISSLMISTSISLRTLREEYPLPKSSISTT